ncbi:hypothetical protein PROPEN_04143 [Proteus penneri ATCC 35198]|nr:hypothetical protein PROPEN_04143 [Proteus penneri ATCC 35198]
MQEGAKSDNLYWCEFISVCYPISLPIRHGSISVFYFSLFSL